MAGRYRSESFLQALKITQRDVVCLVGAGGKTSLMFRLAEEAKLRGYKVLVTTTTRMKIPAARQYNALDLSGTIFAKTPVPAPGIYVAGLFSTDQEKMAGVSMENLGRQQLKFDLVLIEADGAARKPLKGWNTTEPVIPHFSTKTIGIIDIQTIGRHINDALVHRLRLFLNITGAREGEPVSIAHILRIITHKNGLFQNAQGEKLIYINKVESDTDHKNVIRLLKQLTIQRIVAGSIHTGVVHV